MKPGFIDVITYGNPLTEMHGPTGKLRTAGWRWGGGLARGRIR